MLRQRHEATLADPITQMFSALIQMLAKSRWGSDQWLGDADGLPRLGQTYVQRRGSIIRRGRVVECLRPVVVTLYESLFDPPCRGRLRLRWRPNRWKPGLWFYSTQATSEIARLISIGATGAAKFTPTAASS